MSLITTTNTTYRQCTRCVMDTSDPEITFNGKGECNHCTEFLNVKMAWTYQGVESDHKLRDYVMEIKRKGVGKKYDCVIGLSGGVDSCFVAFKCKQLGLSALLVHLDNGWNSETSVQNIESISKSLGFDYISYVLNWEEFRDIQLSHLKASVPEIETPTDIAILEYLHKAAFEYDVKYIVMGGNYITEGILPKSWHYNAKDDTYSKAIHKKFGSVKPKAFPSFNFKQEVYYKFVKGIKIVYLLNDLPYSKSEAIHELQKLGWKDYGQKHHESFYTRIVQSYILPLKFNIDYRKPTLSNKICTHTITREEALQILETKPYNESSIDLDIDFVCKKLGISRVEFDTMMKEPPKTFRDYPNSHRFLEWIYKLYRVLTA